MTMTQAEALQKTSWHSAFAQFGPNDLKELVTVVRAIINNEFGIGDVSAAELTALDGVTAGTALALKALVLDAGKAIATITAATITTLTTSAITGGTGHADINLRIPVGGDVAATGTNLATAAQLLEGFQVVTGADGTVGVKLPATPVAGTLCIIKGTTSAVLKVWPDAAATINAIGSNGAMSLASGVIPAIFLAKSPTQWYTLPLLPS